jgi:hypothetical protein
LKLLLTEFPFLPAITTSSHDIVEDFFIPALKCSIKYDRGVGFFSSGWFRIASKGMVQFAANGGYARWVTSPILNEKYQLILTHISDYQREAIQA